MKTVFVIYHGHAGAVSAVVAAAIHAGRLPEHRVPSIREILAVPGVRELAGDRPPGRVARAGRDARGHEILFLSHRACFDILERAFRQVGERLGVGTSDILYVDAMPAAGWPARTFGAASQFLRVSRWVLPVLVAATRRAYPRLSELVRKTRGALERSAPSWTPGAR